jgi:PIN domain nuclease of toxin-antitoxin system
MTGLLLDTHAWLWYAEGVADRLSPAARTAIETARRQYRLHVSSISVWEIGILCAKGKIALSVPVQAWIRGALAAPGLGLLTLDAETALESTQLPDSPHGDPADRFLIATARVHGLTLATADAKIVDYAAAGHLRVLTL